MSFAHVSCLQQAAVWWGVHATRHKTCPCPSPGKRVGWGHRQAVNGTRGQVRWGGEGAGVGSTGVGWVGKGGGGGCGGVCKGEGGR